MALTNQPKAKLPEGGAHGVIVEARETEKTFGEGREPEPVFEIVIQPDGPDPRSGLEYFPVSVLYTPNLNGVSALSNQLARLGIELGDGEVFHGSSLTGIAVAFDVEHTENGFVKALKDTVRLRE